MQDTSHLAALHDRLSRELARLAQSTTKREKEFRAVQVAQAEREIAGEMKFLGMDASPLPEMSDDELFAELAT